MVRLGHVNVTSLCNKIDCVDLFGREWAIDTLAISKPRLISSIKTSFIALDGFCVVRGDTDGCW